MRARSGRDLLLLLLPSLTCQCVQPKLVHLPDRPQGAKTLVIATDRGQRVLSLGPDAKDDEVQVAVPADDEAPMYLLYYRCDAQVLGLTSNEVADRASAAVAPPTDAYYARTGGGDFQIVAPGAARPQLQLFPRSCAELHSQTLYSDRVGYFSQAYQVAWLDPSRHLFAASTGALPEDSYPHSAVLIFSLNGRREVLGPCPLNAPGLRPLVATTAQATGELFVLARRETTSEVVLARARGEDVPSCTSSQAVSILTLQEIPLAVDQQRLKRHLGLEVSDGPDPELCIYDHSASVYCQPSGTNFIASSSTTIELRMGLKSVAAHELAGFGVCDVPGMPPLERFLGCPNVVRIRPARVEPLLIPGLDEREVITSLASGPLGIYVGSSGGALYQQDQEGRWSLLDSTGGLLGLVDGIVVLPSGVLATFSVGGDLAFGRPGCATTALPSTTEGLLVDGDRALLLSEAGRIQTLTEITLDDPRACALDAP